MLNACTDTTATRRLFREPGFLDSPGSCAREGFAPRALREDGSEDGDDAQPRGVAPGVVVLWLLLSLLLPLGERVLTRGWCCRGKQLQKQIQQPRHCTNK